MRGGEVMVDIEVMDRLVQALDRWEQRGDGLQEVARLAATLVDGARLPRALEVAR